MAAGAGIGEIVTIGIEGEAAESVLVGAPAGLNADESGVFIGELAVDEGGDDVDEFEFIARGEVLDLHGQGFLDLDDVRPAGVELLEVKAEASGGRSAKGFEGFVFLTGDPKPQE